MRNFNLSYPTIAPSLLAANKEHLFEEISFAIKEGMQILHFDVMDGKFVPAISFGMDLFSELRNAFPDLLIDTHLMVEDPLRVAPVFGRLESDIVTFHLEAYKDKKDILETIIDTRESGAKVGLSIKPNTPISSLFPYFPYIDLALLMSVEPGKGGQSFIESSYLRMKELKEYKEKGNYKDVILEIDGGINEVTGPKAIESGAELLVAGSYLFGHLDFKERMEKILR